MKNLTKDVSKLWNALSRWDVQKNGRIVLFMSACEGEGTSSVASSFAMLAEKGCKKSTWLIDLGFPENKLHTAFQAGFAGQGMELGHAYDASFKQKPFYTVTPELVSETGEVYEQSKLLTVHRLADTRLMVTAFRSDLLKAGQKVGVRETTDYWQSLRSTADWAVLDAPALERSEIGLHLCRAVDGVVLVVRADKTSAEDVKNLQKKIESNGGTCLGVVFNHIQSDAKFVDRIAL